MKLAEELLMRILGLEFSCPHRSVAIADFALASRAEHRIGEASQEAHPATRPLALVKAALGRANMRKEDVEGLAIGLGPGSYTGIRMAIAVAQGWQLARKTPVVGVSTALCLARQLKDLGRRGEAKIVMDAHRGEFYLGTYCLEAENIRELAPLQIVPRERIHAIWKSGETLAGPDLSRLFPGAIDLFPQALTLCRLAAEGQQNWGAAEQLCPIYLRQAQFVKRPSPRHL